MPNALLVYPKNPVTFWSFDEALKLVGKKSAFPPLGLLTIAGLMPDHYDLRVVDVNVQPLTDDDLHWADIAITSSKGRLAMPVVAAQAGHMNPGQIQGRRLFPVGKKVADVEFQGYQRLVLAARD